MSKLLDDCAQEEQKRLKAGFLRLDDFVGPGKAIPVSRSTWYSMIRAGKAPAPIAFSSRIAVYPIATVQAFIESFTKVHHDL